MPVNIFITSISVMIFFCWKKVTIFEKKRVLRFDLIF